MFDSLIYYNSPFEQKYIYASSYRWPTFKVALNLFAQRGLCDIIETGCVRQKDDFGAGYSTVMFCDFLRQYRLGSIHTVDNNINHINICRELVQEYLDEGIIKITHDDSVKFLKELKERIDLLYLDSYDYPVDETNIEERDKSQIHCLNEITAAWPKIHKKSIILIDDNSMWDGGKPRLAKAFLRENGWVCLLDSQQTLWIKG